MRKIVCFIISVILLMVGCFAAAIATDSPSIEKLYNVDSDYMEKTDSRIGLEFIDAMRISVYWDEDDQNDWIDAEVEFPLIPEDLALVIITDGISIARGQWDLTSGHSMHVYFQKEDVEQFIRKEAVYLVIIRYKNGIYFYLD